MHDFQYRGNELFCEEVPVRGIAEIVGTPLYLYSLNTLENHFRAFQNAFSGIDHLICFSVKANSNISILRIFIRMEGGVDVVSGGELFRSMKAGASPNKIVYSGVGKREDEIEYALELPILMFNIESTQELVLIDRIAGRMKTKAPIALRVNPDVDPKTHPYISTGLKKNKFGINIQKSLDWILKNRFAQDHPDKNLAGATINIRTRRKKGKIWMTNRDIGTSFALRFLTDYYHSLNEDK